MPDDAIERARARELLKRAFLARSIGYVDLPPSNLVSIPCAIDALLLAFASQQAPAAGPLPEKRGLEELALLYNHADDDSRQFTRWQMLAAINHGIRLSAMLDAAPSVTLGEVG